MFRSRNYHLVPIKISWQCEFLILNRSDSIPIVKSLPTFGLSAVAFEIVRPSYYWLWASPRIAWSTPLTPGNKGRITRQQGLLCFFSRYYTNSIIPSTNLSTFLFGKVNTNPFLISLFRTAPYSKQFYSSVLNITSIIVALLKTRQAMCTQIFGLFVSYTSSIVAVPIIKETKSRPTSKISRYFGLSAVSANYRTDIEYRYKRFDFNIG